MTSSPTKTLLVFVSLLLTLAAAGFSYEFYIIHREGGVSAELESRVLGQKSSTEMLDALRSIQSTNIAEVNKLDDIIIAKENPVPFLDLLESTAKRFGLKLRVSAVTVVEGKGTRDDKLTISLETEGSWQQTIAFVHTLESLPYHVIVDNLSITTDVSTGSTAVPTKQVWRGSVNLVLNVQ